MLNKDILHVLRKFQVHSKAYVMGGYLRDTLAKKIPSDVDIAVELDMMDVKKIFPSINGTPKGMEFGVGRFQYASQTFEISTYHKDEFIPSLESKDFVINTLFHDGDTLFDPYHAQMDIEHRLIRSQCDPYIHFENFPQAFIRAIRLSCELNFNLSDNLVLFLHENPTFFYINSEYRKQNEAYKIISSQNPLNAFYYLSKIKILPPLLSFPKQNSVSFISSDFPSRLAYLAHLLSPEIIDEFCHLFFMPKNIFEKYHYLYNYFLSDTLDNKKYLSDFMLVKRYQFKNDTNKLKEILIINNRD